MTDPNTNPKAQAAVQSIVDRLVASNQGLQHLERSILGSLQTYSETAIKTMDELVRLDLPSEAERRAAEQVRVKVLEMTKDLIDDLERALPKTGSGG